LADPAIMFVSSPTASHTSVLMEVASDADQTAEYRNAARCERLTTIVPAVLPEMPMTALSSYSGDSIVLRESGTSRRAAEHCLEYRPGRTNDGINVFRRQCRTLCYRRRHFVFLSFLKIAASTRGTLRV
jgi:hypothetical protein